ncbi:MAG: DNRLRE domain-containing protein [Actinomycetota bacterium]
MARSSVLRFVLATALVAVSAVVATQLPVSAATTSTFITTADAQVQQANASTNYGTSTTLRVDGGTDPAVETYLRFGVSGLSGTIQNAKLRLWVGTDGTANGPAVYTTADNVWGETTLTWTNRPTRTTTPTDDKGTVPTNAWLEFDVTSLVTGNAAYNFVLAGTSTDGVNFDSREAVNKPQLVITTSATGDTIAPSIPTGLSATPVSGTRIDLAWTASTDNVAVTNYEIYRNGASLAVVGNVTSYSDTSVLPATGYSYQVRALDAVPNASGLSTPPVTATTPAGPTTSTFITTADAQVQQANASTNYGTSTTLRVDGGTDPAVETYLRFGVSGLSGTIQNAKLRLWVGTDGTANGPAVYTTADNVWGETTLTWTNRPTRTTTPTDDKGTVPTNAWLEFDVTSLVTGNAAYNFVLAGTSTDGVNFDSREAVNKPQLVITTSATGDTIAPSIPTGLSATPVSGTRIDLAWTASTDNVAVTNYEIFRDGSLFTTVANVTTYADLNLSPSTSYSYQVKARDAANNRSGLSNTAGTTTLADTTKPSQPTLTATVIGAHEVDLSWTASTDDVGVTNYEIYRNGTLLTRIGNVTTFADTTTAASSPYQYFVRALDAVPNASDPSNTESVTTPGGVLSGPTGLTATPVSGTRIDLAWTASTDSAVTGYEIFRGGVSLTSVGNVTAYSDLGVTNGTQYTYKVRAFDVGSNLSGFSNTATATTPDTQNPSPPTNLSATAVSGTRIDLAWTAGTDNVGVTGYDIVRGGAVIATIGNLTTYSDTSVMAGVTYSYQVRAIDAAGHRSADSNTATAPTSDLQAPSQPTNLLATAVAYNRIDLSWTASTDNVAVTNYEILRGGVVLTTVGAVTSYTDLSAAPGLTYAYQVRAKDLAGNTSAPSNTSSATTPQQVVTLLPTADAQVQEAAATSNFGTTTALRVDGGTDPDVESNLLFTASGLAGTLRSAKLRIWATSGTADGPAVYTTATSWTETGITWASRPARTSGPTDDKAGINTGTWVEYDVSSLMTGNGTWAYVLAGLSTDGVDFNSREGTNKPQLVITMGAPDTSSPTAPTGLAATAGSPTQVDLTWTASTDDVGVTAYDVYRGGTQIASLGAVTAYSDTSAKASTTYNYTVKARDQAGNVSGVSNTATITTPSGGGTTSVIAAAGDIACANTDASFNGGAGTSTACHELYTSNLLVSGGYAAVLPLGDNQYNSGSLSQFNAVYAPTWGRVKTITHPVIGNHEYGTPNGSGYFTYFGSSAGDPAKGYYSYDIGSWHVIALNSNCTIVACTTGSAQEQWLRADLSAHPAVCTLAYSHHARWSSGHDGDNVFMQPLWQALFDGGADVMLSGHSHNYERFAPQNAGGALDNTRGIRQFVVGTGGAFFTGVGTAHANSQVRNNTTFGILKMTLRSSSYDWQFLPDGSSGTFTDSGSTSCH